MRIGVFLHGTTIMQAAGADVDREERVRQVVSSDPSIWEFAEYIPTPGTAEKLAAWDRHGASIVYLSAHRQAEYVHADESVIKHHEFPAGPVCAREWGEDYGALVDRLDLDVLVEDDCESIGGVSKTCTFMLSMEARRSVRSIVLPEFLGLGGLPDDPAELAALGSRIP
ncbi:MAG TPA: hypothetical protein VFI65_04715 [Streptosporangiaceae bacterium]|nr:hypothetical protein [Streptosporangiaceae bacterium]